jgi:hypothetical protein
MEYASSPEEHPGTQTRKGTLGSRFLRYSGRMRVSSALNAFGSLKKAVT